MSHSGGIQTLLPIKSITAHGSYRGFQTTHEKISSVSGRCMQTIFGKSCGSVSRLDGR